MKTKIMIIVKALLVGIVFACLGDSVDAAITDVSLFPEEPTISDVITIITSGVESRGAVLIDDSNFDIAGSSLQLDLFLNVGVFQMMTPWTYSENIVTLPAGFYELTVRTFEVQNISDTYSMTFEVVPEPASILLLSIGMTWIGTNHRKKSLHYKQG